MSCAWPKASDVHRLVKDLSRKYGLAMYDPQSDEIIYPDGAAAAKSGASRHSFWIVAAFALLFAAMFVYTGELSGSGIGIFFYVFAMLCGLMA